MTKNTHNVSMPPWHHFQKKILFFLFELINNNFRLIIWNIKSKKDLWKKYGRNVQYVHYFFIDVERSLEYFQILKTVMLGYLSVTHLIFLFFTKYIFLIPAHIQKCTIQLLKLITKLITILELLTLCLLQNLSYLLQYLKLQYIIYYK